MKSAIGIRAQLAAGIIIITITAIGLLGVLSVKLLERNTVGLKVREAESMARLLRGATIEAPWRADKGRVAEYTRRIVREVGLRSLQVTDERGNVLVKEGEPPMAGQEPGSTLFYEDGIKIRSLGGGWFTGPPRFLHVSVGGSVFPSPAALSFVVSLSDIHEDMAGIRHFLLFYALFDSLIIIALGVYFLSRSIIHPIKRLETTATRIAEGGLEERADISIDNEIGRLAAAFNTMAKRLEDEIKRLARVNSELVEAQEELLRSQTLAAMGRLSAGLAHEIGNPLGAVQGYMDILLKGAEDKEEEKDILLRTEKEISRINMILREFLDMSRPSKGPPGLVNVNELVGDTLAMMAGDKRFEGVRTELVLKRDVPTVIIHDGKLRQVFINLLMNAADAMEGSGVVTVGTATEERRQKGSASVGSRRGDPDFTRSIDKRRIKNYVSVSFRDTGCGISEEEMSKIFDPFYTTKVEGKGGTGLGLVVSQGIIRTYGGMMEVASEPGKGSTFKVLLPAGKDENTGD